MATTGTPVPASKIGQPWRLTGWAALACIACCAAPFIGPAVTGGALLTAWAVDPTVAAWFAGASGLIAVFAMAIVRRTLGSPNDEQAVCRLPQADRAQRTAEFRALFDSNEVRRERTPTGVRWSLPGTDNTEAESRRLASLEERCCDGIKIHVHRQATAVVWEITGPPATTRLLDAFYGLPVLIASDAGAEQLWATLDAAACGPSKP